jgi:hypothetical protein
MQWDYLYTNPFTMSRFLILFLLLAEAGVAQQRYTANTLTLGGESPGDAGIGIMSWLAGHWKGEAFGGIGEEWWSSPLEGAMMGIYRASSPRFNFYEILTIYEQEGSLLLRLKHFNRDLTGWEEKDETIDFPFIRATAGLLSDWGRTASRSFWRLKIKTER